MNKYIEVNLQLAKALGWEGTHLLRGYGPDGYYCKGIPPALQNPEHPDHNSLHRWHLVPDWAGSWRHCGPLIAQYGLILDCDSDERAWMPVVLWSLHPVRTAETKLSDYPDKDAAVRYAIVQAVIAKLGEST